MYIFAEPMSEDEIDTIQNSQKAKVAAYERSIMGIEEKEEDNVQDEDADATVSPSDIVEAVTAPPTTASTTPSSPGLPSATTDLESNLRPLHAMTLTIRSRVNGRYVERPTHLTPEDKWAVEYSLAEISPPSRAWALYEATKERRRKLFERIHGMDDLAAATAAGKDGGGNGGGRRRGGSGDGFIEKLREMSFRGREWREGMDRREEGVEKVVLGGTERGHGGVVSMSDEPEVSFEKEENAVDRVGETSSGVLNQEADSREEEKVDIEGTEDYMAWLYKHTNKGDVDIEGTEDYMAWLYKSKPR